jgi:hypothetical protein
MTVGEARTAGVVPRRRTDLRRAGTVTLVSGAFGAACAVAVLLTPPMVPVDRFSYPFGTGWFVVSQLAFAAQHVAMLAGVLGLAGLAPVPTKVWRPGLVMAGAGLVLLAGCEVFGLTAASVSEGSSTAGTVGAAYGVPTVLVGLGFLLSGWVVLRQGLLTSGRWLPIAFGVWVFVVLVPALSSGSHVAGRLAIGGWMVLYLFLGVALRRRAA